MSKMIRDKDNLLLDGLGRILVGLSSRTKEETLKWTALIRKILKIFEENYPEDE